MRLLRRHFNGALVCGHLAGWKTSSSSENITQTSCRASAAVFGLTSVGADEPCRLWQQRREVLQLRERFGPLKRGTYTPAGTLRRSSKVIRHSCVMSRPRRSTRRARKRAIAACHSDGELLLLLGSSMAPIVRAH